MAVCMVYGMELYNHVLMGAPLLPAMLAFKYPTFARHFPFALA